MIFGGIEDKDLDYFKSLVIELANTLKLTSSTELELGVKTRELEKKNIKLANLQMKESQNISQNNLLKRENSDLLKQNLELNEKNFDLNRKLQNSLNQTKNLEKHIEKLNKRIEFLLENDINSDIISKDKLRKCISELMKDNENSKRELKTSQDKNLRNQEKINKMNSTITRLHKKVLNFTNKTENDEDILASFNNMGISSKDDPLNLITNFVIPSDLKFRLHTIKSEYLEKIYDLLEHGSVAFANNFINANLTLKQKKQEIVLLSSQLISYLNFSKKQNRLIIHLNNISQIKTIKDLKVYVSSQLKDIFNCENVNLWIIDGLTGFLQTVNSKGSEIRCIMDRGLFGELIKKGKAINKRDIKQRVLYQKIEGDALSHVDSALLLPIKNNNNKIIGILEISNIIDDSLGFDEEYCGLVSAIYLTKIIETINKLRFQFIEIKFKEQMFQFFVELMSSKSFVEFQNNLNKAIFTLVGSTNSILYLIQNNKIISSKKDSFPIDQGIAGKAISTKKNFLTTDIKSCQDFNKLIDIETILPVIAIVLIDKQNNEEVLGVLEVTLRKTNKINQKYEFLSNCLEVGIEETSHQIIVSFCHFIVLAIKHCKMEKSFF